MKSSQNPTPQSYKLAKVFIYIYCINSYSMEIKTRPYKTEDTQYILDIINHAILHSTSLYDYNIRNYEQQKTILEEKINKNFPVIVAELNGIVVGFGMYSEFRDKQAYQFTVEHSIYVDENFHGKGIGKQLLQELIDLARKQKIHTMIGVIDSENQGSVIFHEKFGFKTVGVIKESGYKFDRWLDSVLMQLIF